MTTTPPRPPIASFPGFQPYTNRYRAGEPRSAVFFDMVAEDARRMAADGRRPRMLDIGCGHGFDADHRLQEALASEASVYTGIEPDADIAFSPLFHQTHRCILEDAPIAPSSIDIAFAVMVLEHLDAPDAFMAKLHEVLSPGGVFWGFTVDDRHWFTMASRAMEATGLKASYLNALHGKRGSDRYENYGVRYRCNRPGTLLRQCRAFSDVAISNFDRDDQIDFYVPGAARPALHAFERFRRRLGMPGPLLVVRLQK